MKSTSGIAVYYRGVALLWSSRRQTIVATSTAAAEYCSIHDAIELTKGHGFLAALVPGDVEFPKIFNDNMSALAISKQEIPGRKSRHLMIRMANVHQYKDRLNFISSGLNLGDQFTKANMTREKLKQLFEPGSYAYEYMKNKSETVSQTAKKQTDHEGIDEVDMSCVYALEYVQYYQSYEFYVKNKSN
jgi:hypothetical protein